MRGRFGPFGPFGGAWDEAFEMWMRAGPGRGRWMGRRVDRGDVKYLILSVLKDGPKHGYEIIREIETRSQGAYAPSPGTIYPTLQMLEDLGYVRSQTQADRRVYELTDAGRAYLDEHRASEEDAWQQFQGQPWRGLFGGFGTEEQRQLQAELVELARALFANGRVFRADARTLARVRDAIKTARQQVDAAFSEFV